MCTHTPRLFSKCICDVIQVEQKCYACCKKWYTSILLPLFIRMSHLVTEKTRKTILANSNFLLAKRSGVLSCALFWRTKHKFVRNLVPKIVTTKGISKPVSFCVHVTFVQGSMAYHCSSLTFMISTGKDTFLRSLLANTSSANFLPIVSILSVA